MNLQFIFPQDSLWQEVLDILPHDIYHLANYVSLEAKRYQASPEAVLIHDQGKIFFLPYLIRRCGEELRGINSPPNTYLNPAELGFDVVSPYGYPGILMSDGAIADPAFFPAAIELLQTAWRDRKICSAFLRMHPTLNESLHHFDCLESVKSVTETVSVDLSLSEAELWTATRKGHRSGINKCKREGLTARMIPLEAAIHLISQLYEETMARVGAAVTYYSFNQEYFWDLHRALGDRLFVCLVEHHGKAVCAGLYSEQGGIVQSLLGGTDTAYLPLSPSLLETDYVRLWAKDRGNRWLHLGGGVGGEHDSVFTSKSGYSKTRHSFITLRLVVDEQRYQTLVHHRAQHLNLAPEILDRTPYFPAYRAS